MNSKRARKGFGTIVGSRYDDSGRMMHVMLADDTTLLASYLDVLYD